MCVCVCVIPFIVSEHVEYLVYSSPFGMKMRPISMPLLLTLVALMMFCHMFVFVAYFLYLQLPRPPRRSQVRMAARGVCVLLWLIY